MGLVLHATASPYNDFVEIDFGSGLPEVSVKFDVWFTEDALDYWVGATSSGFFAMLLDPAESFLLDTVQIYTFGPEWQDQYGTGVDTIIPEVWTNVEIHFIADTGGGNLAADVYIDGVLAISNTAATIDDVQFVRIGIMGGPINPPVSAVYIDNIDIRDSRGGSVLVADDFESGTFDAWTTTSGDVEIVPDPSIATPATAVTRVSVAFAAGPLAVSPTWTDLASLSGVYVVEWTLERGRKDELSKTGAGTANVTLVDREGVFDPNNGASSLFPNVLPDKQILIELWDPVEAEWQTRFRGTIEAWNYVLAPTEEWFNVTIDAVDWFGWLNDHLLEPGDGDPHPDDGSVADGFIFYEDTTGVGAVSNRLKSILTDAGFPYDDLAELFTGNVQAMEVVYPPGTEALAALFDAADAEFPGVANLYVDREGILTFHGRQARFRPEVAAYGIREQTVGDWPAWQADPTVCPVAELEFVLGKTMIRNSVSALPQGVLEADVAGQLVEDSTSITDHGKKSDSYVDLLTLEGIATGNDPLQETLLFATYFVDNYKDPLVRISRLVFKTREPSDVVARPLWHMLCRSDISDLLTVITTQPGGGGFASEGYYIEGLRQTCRPANVRVPHVELELDVSPKALFDTNPFSEDVDPE